MENAPLRYHVELHRSKGPVRLIERLWRMMDYQMILRFQFHHRRLVLDATALEIHLVDGWGGVAGRFAV